MINYAYSGNYQRINWKNYDNTNTPLNADNLNLMDATIDKHDKALTSQGEAMSSLDSEMRNLSNTVNTFDTRIRTNTNNISSLDTRVSNIEDEIEHLDVKTSFSELKDVQLSDLQDGDVPIYDSEIHKWKNGKADIGLFVQDGLLYCRYESD